MKKIANNKKSYLAPSVHTERIVIESSICASSDVKKINTEKPNVEVDDWDEIGNEISFD